MTDTIANEQDVHESVTGAAQLPKSVTVTKLLRRTKGATVPELQEATDWQPHSVRAFLSGMRKKGSVLTKAQRKSGETAYRLTSNSVVAPVSYDPA